MKLHRRHLLLASLAALALNGCKVPGMEPLRGTAAYQELSLNTPRVNEFATVTRDLAWQLMQLGDHQANTVASPSSLASALALIGLGATGSSAETLDQVFGMTSTERAAAANALRTAMAEYDSLPDALDAQSPPAQPIAHQATHLVIIGPDAVAPEFLNDASQYFDAAVARTPRSTAQSILDDWVRTHTANLIEKSAIKVSEHTKLVIQDALLFAAAWRHQFETEEQITFTRLNGSSSPVDGLWQAFECPHAEQDGWQAVRLPYTEGFAMDILLPPEGTSPYQADLALLTSMTQALSTGTRRQVRVGLPILDTSSTLDLKELLTRHGVDLTSFDGIFPGAEVEQAAQQTRLQITAKGTVGAAVTEIGMEIRSAPSSDAGPISFIVNHPYLLNVVAEDTKWSLFLAAITDPTG